MINTTTITGGFTQSELSLLSNCAQRWNWAYNLRLTRKGAFVWYFIVGDSLHQMLEQIYRTLFKRYKFATLQIPEGVIPGVADIAKLEYWNEVLPRMMDAYVVQWKDHDSKKFKIISYEQEIEVEYRGFLIRGKIDLTTQSSEGIYIWDHKSSLRLNKSVVDGWDFKFQFLFYLWLMKKAESKSQIKGYYINAIKKPELKPKIHESLSQFADRVYQDMIMERNKYFYRERYAVSKAVLDHFEKQVVDPKIDRIRLGIDHPEFFSILFEDKNTDLCHPIAGYPCPYLDLCRHGFKKMGHLYDTRDQKHLELHDSEE